MEIQIESALQKMQETVLFKESTFSNVIMDSPPIISALETGFVELKTLLHRHKFRTSEEEITFFKEKKPKLCSKLIYHQKIYQFELSKPISSYQAQVVFLEKELEKINIYYNKNADFVQYYRSGSTLMDKYYFIRNIKEVTFHLESFNFERDPCFSTAFDFKLARLLANDMLGAYLNNKLLNLK